MSEKAILEINGQRHEFPLVKGTEDEIAFTRCMEIAKWLE